MLINWNSNNNWTGLKKHPMTYIVAGNYNNISFLMSDCIATNSASINFSEKSYKLNASNNTFVALSGDAYIMYALNLYDNWHYCKNIALDYEDENTINEMMQELFRSNINYNPDSEMRVFFLKNDLIFYYDLTFKNKSCNSIQKTYIHNNQYVVCHSEKRIITTAPATLYGFCSNTITTYNIEMHNYDKRHAILQFKNRFSFVDSNDKIILSPCINIQEMFKVSMESVDWNNITIR